MKQIPCEVYSRIVGYFRPVRQWNKGKQVEFAERMVYHIEEADDGYPPKSNGARNTGER